REVEPQAVGCDERAFLLHVRTQNLPQRGVEQVRRGVVECGRSAARAIHVSSESVANSDRALGNLADVRVSCATLLRVRHNEADPAPCQLSRISDLPAGLRVEGRPIEHDFALLSCFQLLDNGPVFEQRKYMTLGVEALIALEERWESTVAPARRSTPNLLASCERRRCCSMAASNPAWSMERPRSRAMSAVRSAGKPNVSYS